MAVSFSNLISFNLPRGTDTLNSLKYSAIFEILQKPSELEKFLHDAFFLVIPK